MAQHEVSFWLSLIQVSHPEQKRFFRYQLHQFIWYAYPRFPRDSKQPFLFSLTGREDEDGIYCLVQSKTKPDWRSTLQTRNNNDLTLKSIHGVKPVHFEVHARDQFFFQLQACPIKNTFQGKNKRGKKAPIYDRVGVERWLVRRSEQNGFVVLQNEFHIEKILVRRKPNPNAKNIILSTCYFNGLLEIENARSFTSAIQEGIGKKKIFGFGMVMLSSVTSVY